MEDNRKGIVVSKRTMVCVVFLALLLIVGGVVLGINWNLWFGSKVQSDVQVKKPDLDDGAVAWQGEQDTADTASNGKSSGIAIPGYKSIVLKANKKEQSINLFNPSINDCYFVISIILPDGTQIWKSKMVEPGKGFYDIVLDKTVSKGKYKDSILKYECYKKNDELTKLNGGEVKLVLEVK